MGIENIIKDKQKDFCFIQAEKKLHSFISSIVIKEGNKTKLHKMRNKATNSDS